MAYQSKYTGLQIDDILDSVEWKQGKIEDLASIRAGAQKGATALQSYTEKYTGTVTGIKINGVVKSGSGVIDLGTISTDISGKQDKLVDGVNIATINGQSLTAGGDLTIEGGAKINELDFTGRGQNGSITEEEWNILKDVDTLKIKSDIGSFLVHKTFPSVFLMFGEDVRLFSSLEMTGVAGEENRPIFSAQTFIFFGPTVDTPLTYVILATVTPTKTSQLENDSNFITSEDVAAVALSGSYNDLHDAPTIPSAITESTVSGWGFTKNAGTITGVKVNGTTKSPTSGVVDLGTVITDVSNLATKDEVILKDVTGELVTTHTQALYGGGSVYALPDCDTGDEDDVLLSRSSVKTINGQSIVGSGDISISGGSGGSGEDNRYFTEFTVEDFIEACEDAYTVTYDTTELFNAMKSNKVICVPYRGYDKGFIVASYKSGENVEYPSMYLQKGDIEYYAWTGDDHELVGEVPTYNSTQVVEIAGGEVFLEVLDNHIYRITDPVDYLVPAPSYIQRGATIHFMSGEFGTTMEMYNVFWANGEIPQIEPNTDYELSLMVNSSYNYNAVLTKFKLVE